MGHIEDAEARAVAEEENIIKKLKTIDISRAACSQDARSILYRESRKIDFSTEETNIYVPCSHKNRVITHRDVGELKKMRQYCIQCLDCGLHLGQEKKKNVKCKTIPYDKRRDDIAREERWRLRSLFSNAFDRAIDRVSEQIDKKRSSERKQEYEEYLRSDYWRIRRERVLVRDNYLCQGCLKNRAEHVHHLSYNHIFNELYFELISLCRECHDKCHHVKENKTK